MVFLPLAWINAGLLWGLGVVVLIHVLQWWKDPRKAPTKYSEVAYAGYLGILGVYMLRLFPAAPVGIANIMYGIFFAWVILILIWLLIINVLPNYLRAKRSPELRASRAYEPFLQKLEIKYADGKKDDLLKDFSRKILHFIQFAGIVIIHLITKFYAAEIQALGINPLDMRNFLYFLIASFFIYMFMVADYFRITNFAYLPNWAHEWYSKSMEHRKEAWTYNAAAPILLANMFFMAPGVPEAIFLSATFISCVSDALASIIGKFYGRHKLGGFGRHPNKSWEGLIAGAGSAGVGVVVLFYLFPIPGFTALAIMGCGIVAIATFIYTDIFAQYLGDNVLNSLLSGIGFYIILLLV